MAKTKLAILPFLCCGEIVKNSTVKCDNLVNLMLAFAFISFLTLLWKSYIHLNALTYGCHLAVNNWEF